MERNKAPIFLISILHFVYFFPRKFCGYPFDFGINLAIDNFFQQFAYTYPLLYTRLFDDSNDRYSDLCNLQKKIKLKCDTVEYLLRLDSSGAQPPSPPKGPPFSTTF